ncbi:chitin synthase-domain-containing protein [Lipomyces japonicus]|uniref:chitin synthase I n=1 Tax=Lipomyces japonicus TaxID=56871 RepID=UPI0034CDF2D6
MTSGSNSSQNNSHANPFLGSSPPIPQTYPYNDPPAAHERYSSDENQYDSAEAEHLSSAGAHTYSAPAAPDPYYNQQAYNTYQPYTQTTHRPISPLPAMPENAYAGEDATPGAELYNTQDEMYPLTNYPAPPGTVEHGEHLYPDQESAYYRSGSPDPSYIGSSYSPTPWGKGESYEINTYDDEEDFDEGDYTEDENEDEFLPYSDRQRPDLHPYEQRPPFESILADGYGPNVFAAEDFQQDLEPDDTVDPSWPIPEEGNHPRRHLTTKRVRLFRGNLVLDCPVSQKLLSKIGNESEREFTHMRYTAATTTPADFPNENFTLRQRLYPNPRQTELFIVVTMYNEDDKLLARTLKGVFQNIYNLCKHKRSQTWGKEGWKKVVVCVVADGREKINPRARSVMAALGCYQEGVAVNVVDDKDVTAHLYEYTTKVGISSTEPKVLFADNISGSSKHEIFPVQMLFCLKEKNQKKINSHRWFFEAFGPILEPKVCVLLDAGTQPSSDSIYHLWKEFDKYPNVGGACGEIKADLGKAGRNLLNPLVAAQNFEYKMSNILDKPLESAFGFISVLPGAFSAYRYTALLNDVNNTGPLEKYFKGETLHDSGAGIFTANMYLAEDRILCYELVSKRNQAWLLRYVKAASAETDVPAELDELILQRRRWLNGSFFAALYSLTHAFNIWRSRHSFFRKIMLHLEFAYQLFSLLFSWFAIGNFFLVFRLLTVNLGSDSLNFSPGRALSVVFEWLYIGCLVTCFILSFGNRPKGTKYFYLIMVIFFAILMCYLIFAIVFISVKAVQDVIASKAADGGITAKDFFTNSVLRGILVSLGSTYVLYFVASIMFFQIGHMFTSFVQYILISPSYINVLNVYAFCNIHDISWGTKGDTGRKLDLGVAKTNEKGRIKIALPTKAEEIDKAYENELLVLQKPVEKDRGGDSKENKEKDYYALVRSGVVLLWMLSNFIIIAVVLQTAGLSRLHSDSDSQTDTSLTDRENFIADMYLRVILWTVAAMAAIRFVGASYYLITRWF